MSALTASVLGARPAVARMATRASLVKPAIAVPLAKVSLPAAFKRAAQCTPRLAQRSVQTPAATASSTPAPATDGEIKWGVNAYGA